MSMMGMSGSNGQWARARNEAGARSLVSELQMDADRRAKARARSRVFWRRVRRRVSQFRRAHQG